MVTGLLSTYKVKEAIQRNVNHTIQYQVVLDILKALHKVGNHISVILTIPTRAPSLPEPLPVGDSSSSNSSPPDSYYNTYLI